jgi:hypothetical protein
VLSLQPINTKRQAHMSQRIFPSQPIDTSA